MFFFDFVYPGIWTRMGSPDRLNEIWYQSFHTCRAYIGYFLRHWAHRKEVETVLEAYVDNFLRPGNLEGGFAHYKASHAGRIAMMKGEAVVLPPITTPRACRQRRRAGPKVRKPRTAPGRSLYEGST